MYCLQNSANCYCFVVRFTRSAKGVVRCVDLRLHIYVGAHCYSIGGWDISVNLRSFDQLEAELITD